MLSEKELEALKIIKRLKKYSFKAYYTGGAVRDKLLKLTPKDIDIVSSAKPDDIKNIFPKTLNIGAKYGVMLIITKKFSFEVSSFRKDLRYKDGRHPERIEYSDEKNDAIRRDFTINGMFFDPIENRIIDYVNGQKDLKRKIIRAIGNPEERFEEDKLRMIRAIRFSTQLNYRIEKKTWEAIKKKASLIYQISAERIRDELFKIFIQKNNFLGIQLLLASNLLIYIFPETSIFLEKSIKKELYILLKKSENCSIQKKSLFTLCLIFNHLFFYKKDFCINEALKKLKLSNKEIDFIYTILSINESLKKDTPISHSNFIRLIQKGFFLYGLKLYQLESHIFGYCENLNQYKRYLKKYKESVGEAKNFQAFIGGKDLIHLGLKPSKKFKNILYDIETEQLEKKILSKEEAILWIKKFHMEK